MQFAAVEFEQAIVDMPAAIQAIDQFLAPRTSTFGQDDEAARLRIAQALENHRQQERTTATRRLGRREIRLIDPEQELVWRLRHRFPYLAARYDLAKYLRIQ